tara:strand:+ start:1941 stop:3218 length:1278 start_codon:yes stop_codon:yes gene_type:complete
MPNLQKIKGLSYLVYGLGLSGLSVLKFFRKNKIKNFEVWDDKKKYLFKKYRTKNLKKSLNRVDYIVLSPGISLTKNKILRKYKKKIITDIDLFYLWRKKIKSIVVTGTNGKSTTCKLIEHLLKKNRLKCSLGGNIGNPILEQKFSKNSYMIIETSSFQLSHSKFISPNFAFFLNLTNDHLDWHGSKSNYMNSKFKIFQNQTKNHFAFVNTKLKKFFKKKKYLSKLIEPKLIEYKKIKYKIKNNYLTSDINDENMSFVYKFSKVFKISEKSFIRTMRSFKGLSHRFEIFFKKKNVIFINDSKATSFIASKSAISSLSNIYWILGGLPKKGDKIKLLNLKKNIIKCYLIGKNTKFFQQQIKDNLEYSITKNLKNSIFQILKEIKISNKSVKYILLSPAAASFDQFKNFEERGDEFKRLSKIYARKYI